MLGRAVVKPSPDRRQEAPLPLHAVPGDSRARTNTVPGRAGRENVLGRRRRRAAMGHRPHVRVYEPTLYRSSTRSAPPSKMDIGGGSGNSPSRRRPTSSPSSSPTWKRGTSRSAVESGPSPLLWIKPCTSFRRPSSSCERPKTSRARTTSGSATIWCVWRRPFRMGAWRTPCLTFVTPTLLAGDRSLAGVVAHEIAHSMDRKLSNERDVGALLVE